MFLWNFLDKDGSICCGRPLLLTGQMESAKALIDRNTSAIKSSGAKTLVTSCPICYKAFNEEYNLDIEILHHSEYILRLIEDKKIYVKKSFQTVVYHDPCELGRNSGIYIQPREVINHVAEILSTKYEYEKGLCCGGSLGNIILTNNQKKQIASEALAKLNLSNADALITGCPLCKKTFAAISEKPIIDIAQLVVNNLITTHIKEPEKSNRKALEVIDYGKN